MPRAQNTHAYVNAGFRYEFTTSEGGAVDYQKLESVNLCFGGITPDVSGLCLINCHPQLNRNFKSNLNFNSLFIKITLHCVGGLNSECYSSASQFAVCARQANRRVSAGQEPVRCDRPERCLPDPGRGTATGLASPGRCTRVPQTARSGAVLQEYPPNRSQRGCDRGHKASEWCHALATTVIQWPAIVHVG